ncbi:hypothetical protein SEUBUCD646_0N03350 [Saccharomyces eubayanus]|uniref:Uncharacterized protein n=1 Tax=Saccharomyces eubayanus TaxID=1080349 RepID=A0ABN8VMS9_SACEU|nr:hypothetical protein SEUBUCD650_0N03340 [Saccharomyces eubayanus]CAI1727873.1 hypothetical protein SEUBUCD646_0N03350 [Saccharomyces eubayanus]
MSDRVLSALESEKSEKLVEEKL